MQLARVIAAVVSTQKHRTLTGATLLLVRLADLDGTLRGSTLLAVDGAGAGIGEMVLVVLEGRAAGQILGRTWAPVDAAIVGIVDPSCLPQSG
jgi:microcompartment protein CcmK/EutM